MSVLAQVDSVLFLHFSRVFFFSPNEINQCYNENCVVWVLPKVPLSLPPSLTVIHMSIVTSRSQVELESWIAKPIEQPFKYVSEFPLK